MHKVSDNGRTVNMEAPERIWAWQWESVAIGQWSAKQSRGTTEFIRADLLPSMLEAEREKALREAATDVAEWGTLWSDETFGDEVSSEIQREILALIPKGGDAL